MAISLKRGPIKPGIRAYKIINADTKFSQNGNQMYPLSLVCLSTDYKGLPLRANLVDTPAARWRLEQFLNAVDAPEEGQAEITDFIGKVVWAETDLEDFNGEQQAKVTKWMRAPDDAEEIELDDDLTTGPVNTIKELSSDDSDLAF